MGTRAALRRRTTATATMAAASARSLGAASSELASPRTNTPDTQRRRSSSVHTGARGLYHECETCAGVSSQMLAQEIRPVCRGHEPSVGCLYGVTGLYSRHCGLA